MNKGQFLMLLSAAVILFISYVMPQPKKKFFICISWLICGIFLYHLLMASSFDLEKYTVGAWNVSAATELFFAVNDDFTPEIGFGYQAGMIIAAVTFILGLCALLFNRRTDNKKSAEMPMPNVKPVPALLFAAAMTYLLPLPFYFSDWDFEYFIIHSMLIMPVAYFAVALYLALTKKFKWYFPLAAYVIVLPAIIFLVIDANAATYLRAAIYVGFAYAGALCALIVKRINAALLPAAGPV